VGPTVRSGPLVILTQRQTERGEADLHLPPVGRAGEVGSGRSPTRGSPAAAGMMRGSTPITRRTHRCPWLGQQWPVARWPREQPALRRPRRRRRGSDGPHQQRRGVEAPGGSRGPKYGFNSWRDGLRWLGHGGRHGRCSSAMEASAAGAFAAEMAQASARAVQGMTRRRWCRPRWSRRTAQSGWSGGGHGALLGR
jgi:hypothetical protein